MSKGIYKIMIGDSFYIGSTEQSFVQRKRTHIRQLNQNKHYNYKMQSLFNKHKNIEFIILEECYENIKERELFYIQTLNPDINIAKTTDCPMKGRKHSEKTRIKMLGKTPWNKGVPRTDKEKQLMSKVKKQRMKLRPKQWFDELSKRSKETNTKPFLGKSHTEENKKKLRESHIKKRPKLLCIETNEVFECQLDAAKQYRLRQGHISENLQGKRASVKGYTFKYVK